MNSSNSQRIISTLDEHVLNYYRSSGYSDAEIIADILKSTTYIEQAKPAPPNPTKSVAKSAVPEVDYNAKLLTQLFDFVYKCENHCMNGAQGIDTFKKTYNIVGKIKADKVCSIPSFEGQRGTLIWVVDENAPGKSYYEARLFPPRAPPKLPPPPSSSTQKPRLPSPPLSSIKPNLSSPPLPGNKQLPTPPLKTSGYEEVLDLSDYKCELEDYTTKIPQHLRDILKGKGVKEVQWADTERFQLRVSFKVPPDIAAFIVNEIKAEIERIASDATAVFPLFKGSVLSTVPSKVNGRVRSNLWAFEVDFGVRVTKRDSVGLTDERGLPKEVNFQFEAKSEEAINAFVEFNKRLNLGNNIKANSKYFELTAQSRVRFFIDTIAALHGITWKRRNGESFVDGRQVDVKKLMGLLSRGNRGAISCFSCIDSSAIRLSSYKPNQIVKHFEDTFEPGKTECKSSPPPFVPQNEIARAFLNEIHETTVHSNELCVFVIGGDDADNVPPDYSDDYDRLINTVLKLGGRVEIWCWKLPSYNRYIRLKNKFAEDSRVTIHTFDAFQPSLVTFFKAPTGGGAKPAAKAKVSDDDSSTDSNNAKNKVPNQKKTQKTNEKAKKAEQFYDILDSDPNSGISQTSCKPSISDSVAGLEPTLTTAVEPSSISNDDRDRQFIEDCLLCPITNEMFVTPVMTHKGGQSYEREALLEWLKNSQTDPLTGEPMTEADLQINYSLKTICENFRARLKKN